MAEAYRNGHEGANPSAMSGTIDGSALTWGIIDAALRKRKRGEAMSLDRPCAAMSLKVNV